MSNETVLLNIDDRGVARVTLNRPEIHNAFDDAIIARLTEIIGELDRDPNVRVLVLASNGRNFSAGADFNWMKRMAANSRDENFTDALGLAGLMSTLNGTTKPTVALIQGAAFGGAVGLAACCDIVIATEASRFALSEVRIGLTPATISPYVVRAIGERQARRYFQTGEAFDATQAQAFGLVHEVVSDDEALETRLDELLQTLRRNGPCAMQAAKDLVFAVSGKPVDRALIDETARRIADIRVSDEGQEGLSAFLEKRAPNWIEE
ncbi:gamma-carboxygeranoyl-CoA hydratase [Marinobacterium nitratireducens]|uniref:Gamma-carboxygeranoyl-CoA hydratase n=1 Tax=Marinobacterium nitratireducens TaxID=518897 RepID=A0A917ZG40_9GAMM|nr:enoyl-CoA hydratase/isomerase family protein [Marinobacterium nitratireducens]GGO81339.1 gamma-carboxygeranoyl-CoA hydratase [Marinobacterium nitratireducens]